MDLQLLVQTSIVNEPSQTSQHVHKARRRMAVGAPFLLYFPLLNPLVLSEGFISLPFPHGTRASEVVLESALACLFDSKSEAELGERSNLALAEAVRVFA